MSVCASVCALHSSPCLVFIFVNFSSHSYIPGSSIVSIILQVISSACLDLRYISFSVLVLSHQPVFPGSNLGVSLFLMSRSYSYTTVFMVCSAVSSSALYFRYGHSFMLVPPKKFPKQLLSLSLIGSLLKYGIIHISGITLILNFDLYIVYLYSNFVVSPSAISFSSIPRSFSVALGCKSLSLVIRYPKYLNSCLVSIPLKFLFLV